MRPNEGGRRDRPRQETREQTPSRPQIQEVIRHGGKPLVTVAEAMGPQLKANGLTTSQIRNVYGFVKQMEMRGFNSNEFVLLKPKLAYAAARANAAGARQLEKVLSWAIDEVGEDEQKFARFVDFFEAILAYHKAAESGR